MPLPNLNNKYLLKRCLYHSVSRLKCGYCQDAGGYDNMTSRLPHALDFSVACTYSVIKGNCMSNVKHISGGYTKL